jgi:transcriptional regulator with XRE-family HTH domain
MSSKRRFGPLVRKLRRERGLSLVALARKIGTGKGYISGIESGSVPPPSAKMTAKMAQALAVDPVRMVLLGWIEKAPKLIQGIVRKRFSDLLDAKFDQDLREIR